MRLGSDALSSMISQCDFVSMCSIDVLSRGTAMMNSLDSLLCAFLPSSDKSALENSLSTVTTSSLSVSALASTPPPQLDFVQRYLENNFLYKKDLVVFTFYFFVIFFVAMYGYVYSLRNVHVLTASIVFTTALLIAFVVCIGLEFTLLVRLCTCLNRCSCC